MTVRIHRVGHERAHVLDLPGPARIEERRVQIQIGVRPLDGCAPQQQKRPQESVLYRSEEMDMDAGGGSCVTSYLQCGGRLGTHTGWTGWTEILWTCPRAVCTGVHPSLLGHRIGPGASYGFGFGHSRPLCHLSGVSCALEALLPAPVCARLLGVDRGLQVTTLEEKGGQSPGCASAGKRVRLRLV